MKKIVKSLIHKKVFIQLFFIVLPFLLISLTGRGLLFGMSNPAMGDLVAMPPVKLPLSNLLYPWIDNFVGSFGGHYFPHVLFSQFSPFVSATILQFIYFYFIFIVLFVVFADFFSSFIKNQRFFSPSTLMYASILTMIVYTSNTFTVNFIQGNPDVYYAYLFSLPAILYLFLVIRDKSYLFVYKFVLTISIAILFAQFSMYYIAFVLIPYFIFFVFYFRNNLKSLIVPVFSLVVLSTLSISPMIYTTIKPAVSALGNVVNKQSSVSSVLSEMYVLYKGIDPLNLFFFTGNSGDYSWLLFNIPISYLFRENILYSLLILQVAIVIGTLVFLKGKQKSKKIPLLIIGLTGIFILSFVLVIIWDSRFFINLTQNFPITPLYRNPKKLIFSAYICFLVVVIFIRLFVTHRKYILIISSILILNILSMFPLLSDGYNGLKRTSDLALAYQGVKNDTYNSYFSSLYSYPDRFLNLRKELVDLDGLDPRYSYRIVVLPDNSQALYQSYLRYVFTPFSTTGALAIWGSLKNPETILDTFYTKILSQQKDIADLLKIGNVKYIVIDRKSPYKLYIENDTPRVRPFYGVFTAGNPEKFNKIISQKDNLTLVIENEEFYVYKNELFKDSMVYIPLKSCEDDKNLVDLNCDFYGKSMSSELSSPSANIYNLARKNITRYEFEVKSSGSENFNIFFNQAYDPFWQLNSNNEDVKISDHEIGNYYGNTWSVSLPREGQYLFYISYRTEGLYKLLIVISTLTIVLCICGVFFQSKKLKNEHE